MGNGILNKYSCKTDQKNKFGLFIDIANNSSHKEILDLKNTEELKKLLKVHGYIVFEGHGIEDAYDSLEEKQIETTSLNKSLFWHIDKKEILTMYYPVGSWRPTDFMVCKKRNVLEALKDIIEGEDIDDKLKIRMKHTLDTTDLESDLDINIAIAELACLNSHIEYESVVTNLLEKQYSALEESATKVVIKKDKCQIIFCHDTSDGEICHGRIRNFNKEYIFTEERLSYFYPKSGAVAMYPDKLNSCVINDSLKPRNTFSTTEKDQSLTNPLNAS